MKIPRALCLLMICALIMIHYPAMGAEKPLTLMIYMTGSNLESEYLAASMDIQEMISSRFQRDYLNLVIMTGGAEKWHSQGIPADELTIYHLERVNLVKDASFPLSSMGRDEVLSTFLQYGYDHFPAEKYALILWDHGSGPVNGVCMDEIFQGDMLLPSELARAMENSPFQGENRLEWVGFDACLMANVETAHLMAPHARYMIASQETEPGNGWDYSFLSRIHEDANGAETGKRIIDLYYESAMKKTPGNPITLSLVDLARMEDVRTGLDSLFGELAGRISSYNFSEFAIQRRDAAGVGRAVSNDSEYDLVDLMGLVKNHQEDGEISDHPLAQAIETAVLYQKSNQPNLTGLSIYHPYYNKFAYQNRWKQEYEKIAASEAYLDYLNSYIRIWMGEEMTNWQNLQPMLHVAEDQSGQTISLQLTPDQLKNFASAELLVFSSSKTWGYSMLYREELAPPDENGLLKIDYTGRELVNCDEEGNILGSEISYFVDNGNVSLIGWLNNGSIIDKDVKMIRASYKVDEEDQLDFLYMEELKDGFFSPRHQIQFSDWKYFSVYMISGDPVYNENGELLPYDQWGDTNTLRASIIDVENGLNFRFSNHQVSNNPTSALIYIYDHQGNLHVTPLVPLKHLSGENTNTSEMLLCELDEFNMMLTGIEAIYSQHNPYIKINVNIENKTDHPLQMSLTNALVDQTMLNERLTIDIDYPGIPAGKNLDTTIDLPIESLLKNDEIKIDQLVLYGHINDEYNKMFSTVCIPIKVDLLEKYLYKPKPVLASSERNGILMEILDFSVNSSQGLLVDFRLSNTTDFDLKMELDTLNCRINQYVLGASSTELILPAGCTTVKQLEFYNFESAGIITYGAPSFIDDLMSAWQIRQIDSLFVEWTYEGNENTIDLPFHFKLKEAYSYEDYRTEPIGKEMVQLPVYENENIAVRLTGIAVHDSDIHVVMEFSNKTDNEISVELLDVSVNDKETVQPKIFNVCKIPGKAVLMKDFAIDFDNNGLSEKELKSVSLSLAVFNTQDGEIYELTDSSILCECKIHVTQPRQEGFFYADQVNIASVNVIENFSVPFIDTDVFVPEQMEQYAVLLSTKPKTTAKEVIAWIVIPSEEYYVPIIGRMYLNQQQDGQWVYPFNGLYLSRNGEEEMVWCATPKENKNGIETWAVASMFSMNFDHGFFSTDGALMEIIPHERKATLAFYEGTAATSFGNEYEIFICGSNMYYPEYDEEGLLLHYTDWKSASEIKYPDGKGIYAASFEFINNAGLPLQFALKPLKDYPGQVYVIYSYELEDGTRYSSEPIPYRDLCPVE